MYIYYVYMQSSQLTAAVHLFLCRELRELSDRLTNDGRDALASLQRQLEKKEEERLAAEREELKQALGRES